MEDEAKEAPYRPKGPAPECDVRSTPSWHFAIWGILSGAYGVLKWLFAFTLGWLVLLFAVPAWFLWRHIPERLMELGRAHRGVSLLGIEIPKVICGLKHPGPPPSLGDWLGSSLGAWGMALGAAGAIGAVMGT